VPCEDPLAPNSGDDVVEGVSPALALLRAVAVIPKEGVRAPEAVLSTLIVEVVEWEAPADPVGCRAVGDTEGLAVKEAEVHVLTLALGLSVGLLEWVAEKAEELEAKPVAVGCPTVGEEEGEWDSEAVTLRVPPLPVVGVESLLGELLGEEDWDALKEDVCDRLGLGVGLGVPFAVEVSDVEEERDKALLKVAG
jgi:hypothetical protein